MSWARKPKLAPSLEQPGTAGCGVCPECQLRASSSLLWVWGRQREAEESRCSLAPHPCGCISPVSQALTGEALSLCRPGLSPDHAAHFPHSSFPRPRGQQAPGGPRAAGVRCWAPRAAGQRTGPECDAGTGTAPRSGSSPLCLGAVGTQCPECPLLLGPSVVGSQCEWQ